MGRKDSWVWRPLQITSPPKRFLLDAFTVPDIDVWRDGQERLIEFYWEYYSWLALQRSKILGELKIAISERTTHYEFENWVRIIDQKFANNPLSPAGSTKSIGGRFNIGAIDVTRYPVFPAIYISETYDTAFKEKFGLYQQQPKKGLSPEDLALAAQRPLSSVIVKGRIEHVLNINDGNALRPFCNLIRGFKFSKRILELGKSIGLKPFKIVKTPSDLQVGVLDPNWRQFPMHVDIPANSQILGQLANEAGIEAILYKSRMSASDCCLAIFPQNFKNSSSVVELDGEYPSTLICRRLDSSSWQDFA
jgi:hypothetical protein